MDTVFSQDQKMNSPPHENYSKEMQKPSNSKEFQEKKLNDLAHETRFVFVRASSVFPFDFFPDEITVDPFKVNIIFREFFISEIIHSFPIRTIKDVELSYSVFFATIKIIPDGYPGTAVAIRYLKRQEAIKARRIIQGLMLTHHSGIDLDKIDPLSLRQKAEQLGIAKEVEIG